MRVLQINAVCGTGSTGRIAVDLATIVRQEGDDCLICYGRGEPLNYDNTYRIGTDFSVNLHALKTRIFDKHGLGSKKATKELIKKIIEYNPDIIHLHNIHGYYLNYQILFEFLQRYNKPIVWTLHDCWSFTGHCSYFDFVQCFKWKDHCFKCPQKKEYPASYILDNSKKNFKIKKKYFANQENLTIVTPSEWLKNLTMESFLGKNKCIVINNGIDLNVFKPVDGDFRESNNLTDKKIILGVANIWDKRKGFDDFIKLYKELSDDCKIVLVGVSEDQLQKLPKNILGINRTNSIQELAQIYSAADIFFNPTYQDNFPTTNLEALACGTSVITYNTGGSVESVDESCGYIVGQGDLENVKNIINNHFKTKESIKSCVSKAQNYDKKDRFREYFDLYKEI